jgi:hypothetical protein
MTRADDVIVVARILIDESEPRPATDNLPVDDTQDPNTASKDSDRLMVACTAVQVQTRSLCGNSQMLRSRRR